MPASCRLRGVTLTEFAIVVAVLALVVSAATPPFAAFLETRRIDGAASQLALDLREARAEALRRQDGVRVRVRALPGGSCWLVHTGAPDACDCAPGGAPACTGAAAALKTGWLPAAARVAVQANVASIRFEPLHGTATPAGTLRVVAASGRAVHHVVNVTGRVRTCTVTAGVAPVPGYRPC